MPPIPASISTLDLAAAARSALVVGGIGSLAFTALLFGLYRAGPRHAPRDPDGRFTPAATGLTRLATAVFVVLLVAVPAAAAAGYVRTAEAPAFAGTLLAAYLAFALVNLWDLAIVDGLLVLGLARRARALPDTPYFTSWRPHLVGFARGMALGVAPALVAAVVVSALA